MALLGPRSLPTDRRKTRSKRDEPNCGCWTRRMIFSRRAKDRLYSAVLVAVVVLSWSYVIYASRIAAQWLLEKRTGVLRQD